MPTPLRDTEHGVSERIYVRLYHFISADHALDDIAKRRLKIFEIDQLNESFELWCVNQKDQVSTDELLTFRSAWKNSNLSAKKKLELLNHSSGSAPLPNSRQQSSGGHQAAKLEDEAGDVVHRRGDGTNLGGFDQRLPGGGENAQCKCVRWFC